MKKYTLINKCRICKESDLSVIISLGNLYLSGVFPDKKDQDITNGPLDLIRCNNCGLLQLRQSYNLYEMYGDNYGYRSGLNKSMVTHLNKISNSAKNKLSFSNDDIILDIGSNDSTLLQFFNDTTATLVGIDPSGEKFNEYYPSNIQLIPKFFSATAFKDEFGNKKSKLVTSIAMFYDLEDPILFMKDIYDILADDGIWIFEQSYMPTMIKRNAYDTICHEHLEYYGLKQIKWMTDIVGFKIIDIELNNINGGSFCVTVAKNNNFYRENSALISQLLALEKKNGFDSINPYIGFKKKILEHKILLNNLVAKINSKGQKLFGYGASTKGNVLLQYCGFTNEDISYIAEVNEDKFDSFTPGSQIPIISEKEAKSLLPDYFLVLPWHFKDHIIKKESIYLESGGKLIFPLPSLEIIRK